MINIATIVLGEVAGVCNVVVFREPCSDSGGEIGAVVKCGTDRRRLDNIYLCKFYSPVVTICTASLTFNNSAFCPHSCIYVFCVDLRTNSH